MNKKNFKRLPSHIGIIPDGNRRWAQGKGLRKQDGYVHGIEPGFQLYELCLNSGIKEITFFGFTQDNTKRPSAQTEAFRKACVDAVIGLCNKDANLLVVGNSNSDLFPPELKKYTKRYQFGDGLIKVNFLVNYGWIWDLTFPDVDNSPETYGNIANKIASRDISRIDLVIRWGGRRRLSGFLPVQTVYSDFFVVDEMWPDFHPKHFYEALDWYQDQEITLGG